MTLYCEKSSLRAAVIGRVKESIDSYSIYGRLISVKYSSDGRIEIFTDHDFITFYFIIIIMNRLRSGGEASRSSEGLTTKCASIIS